MTPGRPLQANPLPGHVARGSMPITPTAFITAEVPTCRLCTWICTASDKHGTAVFTVKFVSKACAMHGKEECLS